MSLGAKLLFALHAAFLTSALAASPVSREIGFPCVGEVNTDEVNIRAGRSLNYEVVAKLGSGDRVTVCGLVKGWFKIQPPKDSRVWVSSKHLAEGKVVAGRLNTRVKPVLNATVVSQLSRGDKPEVIKTEGEWTSIKPPASAFFWVSSELIDLLPAENVKEQPAAESRDEEDEGEGIELEEQPAGTATAQPVTPLPRLSQQSEAPANPVPCTFEGILARSGESYSPDVRHHILKGMIFPSEVCLVTSRLVNLSYYEGDKVGVWGYEISRTDNGIPVVDVRYLEIK